MSIGTIKKEFLKKVGEGIHALMACSFLVDEIAQEPSCPQEEFIKENLLIYEKNMTEGYRHWFSMDKFDTFIDTSSDEEITKLLLYLDDHDMHLQACFYEASIPNYDLTEKENEFALLIDANDLKTFEDFLSY
jgi:hypothetical protein